MGRMSRRARILMFAGAVCLGAAFIAGCAAMKPGVREKEAAKTAIPSPEREFRAVWVATVANIDWPSSPGLPTGEQQAEIDAILDSALRCNMNAVVLQVRPQCDAFYPSELEPWSYFLTGRQGQPPNPYYDPLEYWIEGSHNRGIELHVWFNPYRAHHPSGGDVTGTSVVRTHPGIVRELQGGYFWLDPALSETQDYSLEVLMDVLRRYDIDGVHFDDYFYPYPAYNGGEDFPDGDSWAAYLENGGRLARNDWRRESVNRFIKRLYASIKKEKPFVKFGISPFGIWRPGHPESIQGFDQHDILYADAKLWLNEGWVDYYTPQLYWPISRVPQSYPVLLGWWVRQNTHRRNLWPGLYTSRVSDTGVMENINQIMVTRGFVPDGPGNIHFSMKAILENYAGIADSLANGPYARPALVPASPWLDNRPPAPPKVSVRGSGTNFEVTWEPEGSEEAFRWVVYYKQGDAWKYEILDRNRRSYAFSVAAGGSSMSDIGMRWWGVRRETVEPVTMVAVSAVDRTGNESSRTEAPVGP